MRKSSSDAPLVVDLPAPARENPSWLRVGMVAMVCFGVGIAWPKIVGFRPGPSAPGSKGSTEQHAEPAPSSTTVVTSAVPPVASSVATKPEPVPTEPFVGRGAVLSCRSKSGEAMKGAAQCGKLPGIDAIVLPLLRKISSCSGADPAAAGKLSLLVTAEFGRTSKLSVDVGKSSTVKNAPALAECVGGGLAKAKLDGVSHDHPRYTLAYSVGFGRVDDKSGDNVPDDHGGSAQIVGDDALVRDTPLTGQIVARLPRGTKVRVQGAPQNGWYRVQFGDNASEGWLHRATIGR